MANLSVQEDGGGDYTTLDEALDNIGAGETITIEGEWDAADTRVAIVSTACTTTATGASRISAAKHVAGTPLHYRLQCASDGSHCITANVACTIDGIEIKQGSTGGSDECLRHNVAGLVKLTNCILWSALGASDQDGVYFGASNGVVTLENCIVYNFLRAGVHLYADGTTPLTANVNSSSIYKCGENGETLGGGISVFAGPENTCIVNVHNSWVLGCSYDSNEDYNTAGAGGTETWNVSYSIDSDNSIAAVDGGGAGNQANVTLADTDQGVGAYVIVTGDIDGAAPWNFTLTDLGNAKNNAQDEHNTEIAEGLTIPNADIDGTARPQNTNYDVGAFEIVAAVGAVAPTGVFYGPLIGPFGGPI